MTTGSGGIAGGFAGWPDEALEFYEGLEADNSKAYWEPRKGVYEQAVKAPLEALLAEVEGDFGPFKIMRPYRDVRFSADKTPYKTNIGAGSHTGAGGVYVSFSARGLFSGAGTWHMSKDQLVRYREAVDGAAGAELEAIGERLAEAGFELEGETLKRAPKGWPADHPRAKLLRYTSVLVGRNYPTAPWMATAEAKERVVEVWRAAAPVNAWLDAHVGPAESPMR
ncbi:MAG: DUF2461 domain-containing protein [Actinomycetota bacterium]|nr:DUF2461 domain-containing protein [Actinomycetota bacterium]MDQ6945693.1 DUF2461 domain-containing protein [Actinomycetota bacterium]